MCIHRLSSDPLLMFKTSACSISETVNKFLIFKVPGSSPSLLLMIILTSLYAFSVMAQERLAVDVVYPQQQQQNKIIRLAGTVEASQHARLATLEAGRVVSLHVEVGDSVSKGQLLLTLESQLAQLEVQGVQAEVKAAELNHQEADRLYQEVQRLSAQKLVAKTLIAERAAFLANAEVQLARVKASLNLQQERLNRHSLIAPFDGVIASRSVDVGEWATPQTSVMTLVAQNDLRLAIQIPQQYYSQLQAQFNDDVIVTVIPDAPNIRPFKASLSRLIPVSDIATRTFAAQIDIPADHDVLAGQLVTGMSAMAEIMVPGSEHEAVILPRSAIKQHPDGNSSIFIVQNNTAKRMVTDYVLISNDQVAIHNQPPDQGYIITAVELLKDGSPITVNVVERLDQ